MDNNYTHVTLVVDRSGSMSAVRNEAQQAVNQWIADQKAVDGKMTLTLVEFDAGVNDWYKVVHSGDIQDAPHYSLSPRGMTALLDATGKAVVETGEFLRNLDPDARPAKVLFVVQTDGGENSSKEYTHTQIAEMRTHQESKYAWEFVFLGMGIEATKEAQRLGFANIMAASNDDAMYATSYKILSNATTAYRGAGATREALSMVNVDLTGEDADLVKKNKTGGTV